MSQIFHQWWLFGRATADRVKWSLGRRGENPQSGRASSLRLGALERRLLMSAAPIDPAMMGMEGGVDIEQVQSSEAAQSAEFPFSGHADAAHDTVIFVDSSVPDLEAILDDLQGRDSGAEVFLLDSNTDGVDQITEILETRTDIRAVHVIAHGDGNALQLGNVWLDERGIDAYAGRIASWGAALGDDADLLIYGCDLAGTAPGRELLESLSALTNADVAASVDDTGHSRFGANWELEYELGEIQAESIVSEALAASWENKLAVIQVTTTLDVVDSGDGLVSLREAILQSNSGGGGDTIRLLGGSYDLTRDGSGDDSGDLDIRADVTIVGAGMDSTTISGLTDNRIFDVRGGNTLSISDLTLTDGEASNGGAIRVRNNAELIVERSLIKDSDAGNRGGAIYSQGDVTLIDTRIVGNSADTRGSGVYSNDTLTVIRTSFEGNRDADEGGGLYVAGGTAQVSHSTFSGNRADWEGGAIFNRGNTLLSHVTITDNFAPSGGGVVNDAGSVSFEYSIIAGNSAFGNEDLRGGGLISGGYNLIEDVTGLSGLNVTDITGQSPQLETLQNNGGYAWTHALMQSSPAVDTAVGSTASFDARSFGRPKDGDGDSTVVADIGAFELEPTIGIVTVTTTDDVVDTTAMTISALILDPGSDGEISLREAVRAVNNTSNLAVPDEIHFAIAGAGPHQIELTDTLVFTEAVAIRGLTQSGAAVDQPMIVLSGTSLSGPTRDLISLQTADSTVEGLSLINAGDAAIRVGGFSGNIIASNWIGLATDQSIHGNQQGIVLEGSTSTVIGGSDSAGNLITGNTGAAVQLTGGASDNVIAGNRLGTNASGDAVLHSGLIGISLSDGSSSNRIGGSAAGAMNLIAGFNTGIFVASSAGAGTEILGNTLGTDTSGAANLGNNLGISLARGNVTIGGVTAGEANVIANSAGAAVAFFGSASSPNRWDATIRGNSMFGNSIGIDLQNDGASANDYGTPNDSDDGPNRLMNTPDLATATVTAGTLVVDGQLRTSTDPNVTIDFYYTHTDNRQGRTYLGSEVVSPDGSGVANFSVDLGAVQVADGDYITATATHSDGSTSEFSAGVSITVINSMPTDITLAPGTIDEMIDTSGGYVVGSLSAIDPDLADSATFAVVGGADQLKFSIGGTNGDELILSDGVIDYETQDSYFVDVRVTDGGGNEFTKTLEVQVNDLPDGIITVTTTSELNDTGSGSFDLATLLGNRGTDNEISLTEAIIAANNTSGTDLIRFDISGAGPHLIQFTSALEEINDSIVIDGTTQSGYAGEPIIFISGDGQVDDGLVLNSGADQSVIRGVGILDFRQSAIVVDSDNNTIAGNWIGGFDPATGNYVSSLENGEHGIYITGSGNTVGGIDAEDRNVIGGNAGDGIRLNGSDATGNQILGNWIGLAPDGITEATLGGNGISLRNDADQNTVSRNLIAFASNGVHIHDSSDNTLSGNAIGTDFGETLDLGNRSHGVLIDGNSDENIIGTFGNGNLIANQTLDGVRIDDSSDRNTVRYNAIVGNGGLAIDLGGDGATTNDSFDFDSGANYLQNHPVLNSATISATNELRVDLSFNTSGFQTYRIDFYTASSEPAELGDPTTWIGFINVWVGASGSVSLTAFGTVSGIAPNSLITATATDSFGNTSEFSGHVAAAPTDLPPELSGIELGTIDYRENDGPIAISASVSIQDEDSTHLESATIAITNFRPGEDILAFNDQPNISGSWDSVNGVLTLSGYASLAEYESALRLVTYENTSENPDETTRTVEFTVFDGLLNSTSVSRDISLTAVDDPTTGLPVLPSSVAENQTIVVDTASIDDLDGVGAFTYAWFADGSLLSGETGDSLTLTDDHVDKAITVRVSFVDGMGNAVALTSTATGDVTNVDDDPTGKPSISGLLIEDQTLTASTSAIADEDGLTTAIFAFQWLRDGSVISGATNANYTLDDADVGKAISVVVSFVDDNGSAEAIESDATAAIANVNDDPTGQVLVSGIAQEDAVLSADTGGIADADGMTTAVFTYQWKRDGVGISGADASTYTLGDSDVGAVITVAVEFTDDRGATESLVSSPTSIIQNANDLPVGQPGLVGTAIEDQTLRIDTSPISDADGMTTSAFAYRWYRDGSLISGETGDSYTLTDDDVGRSIRAEVAFVDDNGTLETLTTAATGSVTNINDDPQGSPVILGDAREDELLSVNVGGIADDDGMLTSTFVYQWQRGGKAVSGATGATYLLGDDDVGEVISVVVAYVDDQGRLEVLAASPTAAVENVNDAPSGQPVISGTPTENETLTVSLAGISDDDGMPGSASLQWYRDGIAISGANGLTYTLTDADVGEVITVAASYVDLNGTSESVTSNGTSSVSDINNAPELKNRRRKVAYGKTLKVGTNFFNKASSDADGDALTAVLVSGPDSGQLVLQPDGSFLFVPKDGFSGTAEFTWQAFDGDLLSNVATVRIVVAPPVDTPITPVDPTPGTTEDPTDPGSSDENDASDDSGGTGTDPGSDPGTGNPSSTSPDSESDPSSDFGDGSGDDGDSGVTFVSILRTDSDSSTDSLGRGTLDDHLRELYEGDAWDAGISNDFKDRTSSDSTDQLGWADYALLGQPNEMWNQLDQSHEKLKSILEGEQLVVGSIGVATSSVAFVGLTWAVRSGFLLLGFWQQRPIWSRMDPLVLMQGFSSKDDESLTDVMADQRRKLDQAGGQEPE